jgi:hypothetical protein
MSSGADPWRSSEPDAPRRDRDPRPLLLSAAILVGCLVYGALSIPLEFESNDDVGMLGIARGLFGDGVGDPRLVYQSAFIGALVGSLFRLTTQIDWYSALQWAIALAGFATMTTVVLRRNRSPVSVAAVVVVAFATVAPTLFTLQFTQTSFVCLATALVLLIDLGTRSDRSRWATLAGAMFFAILAVEIRSATLMAAQILLLAVGLCSALEQGAGRKFRAAWRTFAVWSVFALVLTTIAAGLGFAEERIFYADPAWQEFWNHHVDRAFVLENWPRWIGLERIAYELDRQLGITPQQLQAMIRWLPITADLYSTQMFGKMAVVIRGIESAGPFESTNVLRTLGAFREFVTRTPFFLASLWTLALLGLIVASSDRSLRLRALAISGFWMTVPCALWVGIALLFREPPYRVWMPIAGLALWCAVASLAVLASGGGRDGKPVPAARPAPGHRAAWIVLGVLGFVPLQATLREIVVARAREQAQLCAMTDFHLRALERIPDGARVFLAPQVIHSNCLLRPFRSEYPDVLVERTIALGWRNLTPPVRATLFAERSDFFEEVCSNPANMFVLHPAYLAEIQAYLRRHVPAVELVRYAPDLPPAMLACAPRRAERVEPPESPER